MTTTPLVTVYIANHNYGRFLRQSIESVLGQTYQPIELIIIDDGSTDDSRTVIDGYADLPNVRVIYQTNRGLNATNNVALQAAKGMYIIRLDADDYFVPHAIAMMVALMQGNPDIGLVFPDYYYVDEIGNIIGVESRHDFDREVSLYDLPSHGACTMVKTDELRRLGGYTESFSCQDGYELWLKYILNSKVTNITKPLFYYRQHKMSLTQDESRILETRKRIKRYCMDLYGIRRPQTVAIVPVRPNTVNGHLWALHERNGRTELAWAVMKLQEAGCFDEVIVTSSDQRILDEAGALHQEHAGRAGGVPIRSHRRNKTYELVNHSLDLTLREIISIFELDRRAQAIGLLGIETPLLMSTTIREAVDTLALFRADSVVCVRQDQSTFFTHTGDGLTVAFEKSRYNNYERKRLYRRVSGFGLVRIEAYSRHQSLHTPRLGHVQIAEHEALTMQSSVDVELLHALASAR